MKRYICYLENYVEAHYFQDNVEVNKVEYVFYPGECIFLNDNLVLEDINHPLNGHTFDPIILKEYFNEIQTEDIVFRTEEIIPTVSNYLHYGNTHVYGERIGQNKTFKIKHHVKSRYGTMELPIFGVKLDKSEYPKGFFGDRLYRVFIGECPHKDETGKWVTYQKVPSFITEYLSGSAAINQEPNIPHIVRLATDEMLETTNLEQDSKYNKLYHVYYMLFNDMQFCTFSTYIKGLWRRIQQHIGYFHYVKGENRNQFGYDSPKYKYRLKFVNRWKTGDRYIWFESEDWWRYLYFVKDHKFNMKYEKRTNDHCYCAC